MELTDRKKQILKIVTEGYIQSAEPIGSKTVVERMPGKISSATIRNELADLVEMLAAENISLVIRENAGENSTYTKGFLLVFDGKNRRELITWRTDEPALRQNDYWDIKELTE